MSAVKPLKVCTSRFTSMVRRFAVLRNDSNPGCSEPGERKSLVRQVSHEQLDQRYQTLFDACDLLADGFDEFEGLIAEYVRSVPLDPREAGHGDAERFLDWLSEQEDLTDEQRDYVVCQQGYRAVEFVALAQRLAHARFQERLSLNEENLPLLGRNDNLDVMLNPIHVWAVFETRALIDDDEPLPANVLFFPVGQEIRTVIVDAPAEELIRFLTDAGTIRSRALLRNWPTSERAEVVAMLRELAAVGLITLT
ncbi:hypothetical protein Mal4_43010 [Maioricimonas rarisocia]|uniref:DUF2063 domain-containing protein n=1 Tax=Maioricimonas rarisocia TaxID=2528026 RepID=A0A517ZBW0_9PLAN|nr:hypothetical protein [Maioricimonas rarisocia]QDU39947.1 hypothetical protein Mal4_43010 [Maioricimonas rarisocia]